MRLEDLFEVLKLLFIERKNQLEAQNRSEIDRIKMFELNKQAEFGEFSRSLIHEVNNAITIVSGNSYKLYEIFKSSEMLELTEFQKAKAWIESSKRNIDKTVEIINNLRELIIQSRQPDSEVVNLRNIFEEAIFICTPKLTNFGIQIYISKDFLSSLSIFCNPTQIVQVLVNLINNAADAISMLSNKRIELHGYEEESTTVITIQDSGAGIPHELREKIMAPLFTTKDGGAGLGLGLNISKTIISAHGGTIEIDKYSKNTKFIIKLPQKVN